MPTIIGMDEAGYGPNLGPLVIAATKWETARQPQDVDFYGAFDKCMTATPAGSIDRRLHVADSKDVYRSKTKGLQKLETAVMAAMAQFSEVPRAFHAFCQQIDPEVSLAIPNIPWLSGSDLPLPQVVKASHWEPHASLWTRVGEASGLKLKAVRCTILFPQIFNQRLDETGSKGIVLSQASLKLMRSLWDPAIDTPALIIADKHGGRNRYDELLSEIVDGQMIFRLCEGTPLSEYRVGQTDIRFQMKAEQHLPVALASLFAKYIRELAMELFNQYWQAHVPNLKPTKGYPVDALRFRNDIQEFQQAAGVSDEILWRNK